MKISSSNIFTDIPAQLPSELCQTLLSNPNIRIERIVSRGHCCAPDHWYDQDWDEWVMLMSGAARLCFLDDEAVELRPGDYFLIPARCRHRVDFTSPNSETVWLAVHILQK